MFPQQLIQSENVLCNAHARSKKHCLEILSELLVRSSPHVASEEIFSGLIERERLGCTSLDKGVAFPHCRVAGVTRSTGALIKLSEPVDFDSSDGQLVDLIFGLMLPVELTKDHYAEIGFITELMNDETLRKALRKANSSRELYDALSAAFTPRVTESRRARNA
ncbi:MAG: PTS sugar transporter subunit IIA [Steroidobacteraceae bacterium]